MTQPTEKIRLGVFFGGASSEHEISCLSAASVLENLRPERYDIVAVGITRDGAWYRYDGAPAALRDGSWERDGAHLQPAVLSPCKKHRGLLLLDRAAESFSIFPLDCIFPVMHGETCEDGRMQGLLSLSGVPFVGCETRASALTMDKADTKLILQNFGIPQAQWVLLYRKDIKADPNKALSHVEGALSYPVFVKPSGTGSSKGVFRVQNRAELADAITLAGAFDEKILVEEEICGQEVEVALLERVTDAGNELLVSCVGEIKPDGQFYDYDAKYIRGTSKLEIPADVESGASEQIRDYARRIFRALDCRGLSRADFFVRDGAAVFNEINSMPGFTAISMYPKLFMQDGISYAELLDILIDFALNGERV